MPAKRVTRYLSVILRWLMVMVGVFTLTVLAGLYIIDNMLQKVYTATAQIKVQPRDSQLDGSNFSEFEIIQSPEILLSVIRDLGLDRTWAKQVYAVDSDQLPDVDALTHINKMLKLDYKRETKVINITVSSDVPREAADIANDIADQYKTLRDSDAAKQSKAVIEQPPGGDDPLPESPVLILTRAEIPDTPTKPDKEFDFVVTLIVAGLLGVMTASFVEIIFLFLRAGERAGN